MAHRINHNVLEPLENTALQYSSLRSSIAQRGPTDVFCAGIDALPDSEAMSISAT